MVSQATKYELLEAGDKSDRTSSDDGANASRLALALQKERRYLVLFYANIALFLVTITLGGFFWLNPRKPSQMECAKLTSPYCEFLSVVLLAPRANEKQSDNLGVVCTNYFWQIAPLWDIVDFWEGDFTNYFNHTSKYRGPPTLARERAWDDLWNGMYWIRCDLWKLFLTFLLVPGVVIGQDGIDALNKTSQGPWVETTDSTPAKREYKVLIEVFHQLHCLVSFTLDFSTKITDWVSEPHPTSNLALDAFQERLGRTISGWPCWALGSQNACRPLYRNAATKSSMLCRCHSCFN